MMIHTVPGMEGREIFVKISSLQKSLVLFIYTTDLVHINKVFLPKKL